MGAVLYIIGNGFDLHHRLNTKYCHFFRFLRKRYPDVVHKMNASKFFSGLEFVEEDDSSFEDEEKIWSDLEKDLEYAYEEYLEEMIGCYAPNYMDEHPNFGGVIFQVDDDEVPFSKFTGDLLIEWIKYAEMGKSIKDEKLIFSSDAVYLTFNYTNTLQRFYGIPDANILHVHGSLKENLKNGVPLQFGNPEVSVERLKNRLENKYADNPWGSWVTDAIPSLVGLCKALTKNLRQNYENLRAFLRSKEINEVFVMGHSFMGVDKPYYDEVLVPSLEKYKWTFYVHNDDDKQSVLEFKQEHPLIRVEEIAW